MPKSGEVVIDLSAVENWTFRCDMCRKRASDDGGRAQLDATDDDSPSESQQQLDEQTRALEERERALDEREAKLEVRQREYFYALQNK